MAHLLYNCEMLVTVHNKCSKFTPSTSIHFETRVRHSRVDGLSSAALCLCGRQHRKWGWAIRLVCPPSLCKLRSSSNPREKKFKVVRSGDLGGRLIGPRWLCMDHGKLNWGTAPKVGYRVYKTVTPESRIMGCPSIFNRFHILVIIKNAGFQYQFKKSCLWFVYTHIIKFKTMYH